MNQCALPSISSSSLLDLYDALIANGAIPSDFDMDVQREDLLDLERRVPASLQTYLWGVAKRCECPPHIGLIVGTQINENAKGLLSHLLTYAKDLREALHFYEQYISVMSEYETINIEEKKWGYRITFHAQYDQKINISSTERSLSATLTWGRYLTGQEFIPKSVSVPYESPDYLSEYKTVFGDNVLFNQDNVSIEIHNHMLDLAIKSSNDYMKKIVHQHVDKFSSQLKQNGSLLAEVNGIIRYNLASDNLSSSSVSDKLGMSRQTLHRKLKEHDISFRELLEEIRKEKSIEYLADGAIALDEISFLLGFKESSAFHRAFKAWFDISPGQYRKRHLKVKKLNPENKIKL